MACVNGNTLCNARDLCTACRADRPTIAPLVHLNGTSGDALIEAFSNVSRSLAVALDALVDAAPNARDYPLGDDAFRAARTTYEAHVNTLRAMRAEYEGAWEHVQEQLDRRAK